MSATGGPAPTAAGCLPCEARLSRMDWVAVVSGLVDQQEGLRSNSPLCFYVCMYVCIYVCMYGYGGRGIAEDKI